MFIDVHVIQTVPLANLNRDDAGAPKTMPFGGVKRLRVSSQSWKRAAREAIEAAGLAGVTYRTRHPDVRLAELLVERGFDGEVAAQLARWAFTTLGTAAKKGTNVLLFAAEAELVSLADLLAEHRDALVEVANSYEPPAEPAKGKKKADQPTGPDFSSVGLGRTELTKVLSLATHADAVGLFGRMLAENTKVNVDAAVQVAHAFSVHAAGIEFDYFTAVEDLPVDEEGAGAAMIETGEFSTGTLYRYATIDVAELVANCGGDRGVAAALAEAFIKAFALSIPSGKKNATAPNTVPSLVAVTVRPDRPVSYAAAFERPVTAAGGFEHSSVERLAGYATRVEKMVASPTVSVVVNLTDVDTSALGTEVTHVDEAASTATAAVL